MEQIFKYLFSHTECPINVQTQHQGRYDACVNQTITLHKLVDDAEITLHQSKTILDAIYDAYIQHEAVCRLLDSIMGFGAAEELLKQYQVAHPKRTTIQNECVVTPCEQFADIIAPKPGMTQKHIAKCKKRQYTQLHADPDFVRMSIEREMDEVLSERSFGSDNERDAQKQLVPCLFTMHEDAITNMAFRYVKWTNNMQYVYMSLKPGETIPNEVHNRSDQLFIVEDGTISVSSHNDDVTTAVDILVSKQQSLVVPAGVYHAVTAGTTGAKLVTVYSFPEHAYDTVQLEKPSKEMDEAEEVAAEPAKDEAMRHILTALKSNT